MPCNTPQTLPNQITAGLSWQAVVGLDAYPADTWQLTLLLRGPQAIDIAATAKQSQHQFNLTATTTKDWAAGQYWYVLRVNNDTETIEIERGEVEILADFATLPAGFDGRSPNEMALSAIEAVIAKRATLDQERYRINNRELYRTSIADLLKLKAHYRHLVKQERAKKSGKSSFGRQVIVRFS